MIDRGVQQVFPRIEHPISKLARTKRTERKAPRVPKLETATPVYTPAEVSKMSPVEKMGLARAGRVVEPDALTDEQRQIRKEAGLEK